MPDFRHSNFAANEEDFMPSGVEIQVPLAFDFDFRGLEFQQQFRKPMRYNINEISYNPLFENLRKYSNAAAPSRPIDF